MRATLAGFLVLTIVATGCGEADKGRGDLTEGYGLRIDESLIAADLQVGGGPMTVTLPLATTNTAKGAVTGKVSIELLKVGGNAALQSGSSSFSVKQGGSTNVEVALDAPTVSTLGELGGYVLRYEVDVDGEGELYGRRSLFMAVSRLGMLVVGNNRFAAGEQGVLRIIAIKSGDLQTGIEGVKVEVRFRPDDGSPRALAAGTTNALGEYEAVFTFTESEVGGGTVDVSAGTRQSSHQILIERDRSVLLTTDKPLYQPGQTVHIRALAMGQPRMKPTANEKLLLEVEDPQGTKLFKKETTTDSYGIASLRFTLARLVNLGQYKVRVTMGTTVRTKTFQVKRYTLPKFKVGVSADKGYYNPKDPIVGTVQADYFFGKPVKNGAVRLKAGKTEVQGKTDDNGSYVFEVPAPTHTGVLALEATVTDVSGAEVNGGTMVLISSHDVVLQVVGDQDVARAGDPLTLYVLATDPSGAPKTGEVKLSGAASASAKLDAAGLAVLKANVTSCQTAEITLRHNNNELAKTSFPVNCSSGKKLRLTTDKALYKSGETALVEIEAVPHLDQVHINVLQANATVATHTVKLKDRKGTLQLSLTGDMRRTLAIRAHALHQGASYTDRRLIYVQGADQLSVKVTTDKASYRPAESAKVTLAVTDINGKPAPGALGVQVVDEALYALTEFKPGLERRFFFLEQEVIESSNQLKFVSPEVVLNPNPTSSDQIRARMLFASAGQEASYPIHHQSNDDDLPSAISASHAGMSVLMEQMRDAFKGQFSSRWFSSPTPLEMQAWCEGWIKGRYDDFGQSLKVETTTYSARVSGAGMDEKWSTGDDLGDSLYFSIADTDPPQYMPSADGGYMADSSYWGGYDAMASADAGMPPPPPPSGDGGPTPSGDGGQTPKIRQYFPETLYVNPALITDSQGKAQVDLALADSITSWRLSSIAHTKGGQLGSTAAGITVFQEFFVDTLLPTHMVQNDEVQVPVAVYNYLGSAQTVTVNIKQESWFELLNSGTQQVTVPAKGVGAVNVHIKVKKVGSFPFTATGVSATDSDGVKRTVEVRPDGLRKEILFSGLLKPGSTSHTVTIPSEAIDGASDLYVKVYPGLLAEAVHGFEALFQKPHGCFEQTSSTTYPNVMVLSYLKAANLSTPQLESKAKGYIEQGYQRLLTYEVSGGGFSLWGDPPADLILSAFGLMEFFDMSKVRFVDENLLQRTRDWLIGQQKSDGSFVLPSSGYYENAGNMASDTLRATAYVTWALKHSGYSGAPLDSAISYVKSKIDTNNDPYTLAVAANALVAAAPNDPVTQSVLTKLKGKAVVKGDAAHWTADGCSMTYGYGQSMTMETTALVVGALLSAKDQGIEVAKGLAYLAQNKSALGSYGTTQATVLALRALLLALEARGGDNADGTIQVTHNSTSVGNAQVSPATSDVTRFFDLKQDVIEGDNKVTVNFTGTGELAYQVVGVYYLPHGGAAPDLGPLGFSVTYDKTSVQVGESIQVTTTVQNEKTGLIPTVLMRIGLPPGFTVDETTLTPQKTGGVVNNVEIDNSYVVLYLGDVGANPVSVGFKMTSSLAGMFTAPPSQAYPYYTPEYNRTVAMPMVTVTAPN